MRKDMLSSTYSLSMEEHLTTVRDICDEHGQAAL